MPPTARQRQRSDDKHRSHLPTTQSQPSPASPPSDSSPLSPVSPEPETISALLASLSSTLHARHAHVNSRLSSLSSSHSTCRDQLTRALSSYVQRSRTSLRKRLDHLTHLFSTLSSLTQLPSSDPSLPSQAADLQRAIDDEETHTEPMERFDPFQVERVQALEAERETLRAEVAEARSQREAERVELEHEVERLRRRYEEMESQMTDMVDLIQHRDTSPTPPHPHPSSPTPDDPHPLRQQVDELTAALAGKTAEAASLHTELTNLRLQLTAVNSDCQAQLTALRQERDAAQAQAASLQSAAAQSQREVGRLREAAAAADARAQAALSEQQRRDTQAAAKSDAARLRDIGWRERLQTQLAALERERADWLSDRRDLLDRIDQTEAAHSSLTATLDKERARAVEREAALLRDVRQQRSRLEDDTATHLQHRMAAFVEGHTAAVKAALARITALGCGEPPALLDPPHPLDAGVEDGGLESAEDEFARLVHDLDLHVSHVVQTMEARVEAERRRGEEAVLQAQERLTSRIAQLVEAEGRERAQRTVDARLAADASAAQHAAALDRLRTEAAQARQPLEAELRRLRAERDAERGQWEEERAMLEKQRREDVREAVRCIIEDYQKADASRQAALEAQVESILLQRREALDRDFRAREAMSRAEAKAREAAWQTERQALLASVDRRRGEDGGRVAALEAEVQRWKASHEERVEALEAELRSERRKTSDTVRRVRRDAAEAYDALAQALVQSRAEVAGLRDAAQSATAKAAEADGNAARAERRARQAEQRVAEVEAEWQSETTALHSQLTRERQQRRQALRQARAAEAARGPSLSSVASQPPNAVHDAVYDDGDSDEEDSGEATHPSHPPAASSSTPALSSPLGRSGGRAQSVSILSALAPSAFTQSLLTRLTSSSVPVESAAGERGLGGQRLSAAALYWREADAGKEMSSTAATRASTPGNLPSPQTRSGRAGTAQPTP